MWEEWVGWVVWEEWVGWEVWEWEEWEWGWEEWVDVEVVDVEVEEVVVVEEGEMMFRRVVIPSPMGLLTSLMARLLAFCGRGSCMRGECAGEEDDESESSFPVRSREEEVPAREEGGMGETFLSREAAISAAETEKGDASRDPEAEVEERR